ncbi:hypothetical protein AYI68_g7806 [Smittium mucronatum]|uniref:Uncharacterized protein n=1 Tax=Smittium mucronatum TaxID=133383 RepID=A0A1R0GMP2_9FUNG|nr:hypothetical protein AYI68_g7806 [Smittium mucronatum]
MTSEAAKRLLLSKTTFKPLKLRLGKNSASETLDKPANEFLAIRYHIRLSFIVASKDTYDSSTMNVRFTNGEEHDTFKMIPIELKEIEWTPLIITTSAID